MKKPSSWQDSSVGISIVYEDGAFRAYENGKRVAASRLKIHEKDGYTYFHVKPRAKRRTRRAC